MSKKEFDFSKGNIYEHLIKLAIPMTLAQLIQIMYSVVDRIYIGKIPNVSSLALTGLGLTFPIITIVSAFTNLYSTGGAPLCSIASGEKNKTLAKEIMENTYSLFLITSVILLLFCYIFLEKMLYMFGASENTLPYAKEYLIYYLIGTPFVMISTGMNRFINIQGYAKTGMFTILIGAVINIVLDPIFIFTLDMGIKGAGIATVISQLISAIWVILFLKNKENPLYLEIKKIKLNLKIVKDIIKLGMSGFIVSITNGLVQVAGNITLQNYGGDIYIGIMTILSSIRDILSLPVQGLTNALQPVVGYNYGAKKYDNIKKSIIFITSISIIYMVIAWGIIISFPEFTIKIFNSNSEIIEKGKISLNLYFFGFFMMALQFCGQATFVALGKFKQSIFFSIFRKVIIVVPLTIYLPRVLNLRVKGVFLAEPVSNIIGGIVCFSTLMVIVNKILKNSKISGLK